jgi:hypothetical protein
VPDTWYAAKVGSMTWRRPLDGMPAAALESHRLMAFGLPEDSRMTLR